MGAGHTVHCGRLPLPEPRVPSLLPDPCTLVSCDCKQRVRTACMPCQGAFADRWYALPSLQAPWHGHACASAGMAPLDHKAPSPICPTCAAITRLGCPRASTQVRSQAVGCLRDVAWHMSLPGCCSQADPMRCVHAASSHPGNSKDKLHWLLHQMQRDFPLLPASRPHLLLPSHRSGAAPRLWLAPRLPACAGSRRDRHHCGGE